MKRNTDTSTEVLSEIDDALDALERGDDSAAVALVERLDKKVPNVPEVAALRGSIAAFRGDPDEALAAFEKASSLAPQWIDPLLILAELKLDLREDADACLELCKKAGEIATDADTRAQVLLLEAEAFDALNQLQDVMGRLKQVPLAELTDPGTAVQTGEFFLILEEPDQAKGAFKRARELDPESADAHHGVGVACEMLEDRDGMVQAWLRTRELDLADPDPRQIPRPEFEKLVEESFEALPSWLLEKLKDVAVLVEDVPSEDLVRDGVDPRLLGMFSGTPTTEKGTMAGPPTAPDNAVLFHNNLEKATEDREELVHEIRITLLHEAGHYFGLDEDDLEDLGLD